MFERAPKLSVDIDALADQDEILLSHSEDGETLDLCWSVYKLSYKQREIMILSTFMGYSTVEVASILGITVSTALTRKCRAKKRLMAIYSNRENRGMDGSWVGKLNRGLAGHVPIPRFPLSIANEVATP